MDYVEIQDVLENDEFDCEWNSQEGIDFRNTVYKLKQQKMLCELSSFQYMVEKMKHALGIDLTQLRKGQCKHECYRNRYYGENKGMELAWNFEIVDKHFSKGNCYYTVNEKGLKFLSEIFGVNLWYQK